MYVDIRRDMRRFGHTSPSVPNPAGRRFKTTNSCFCSARPLPLRRLPSEGPLPPTGSRRPRNRIRPSAGSPGTTRPTASRRAGGGGRSSRRASID